MHVKVQCPGCQNTQKFIQDRSSNRFLCPNCGHVIDFENSRRGRRTQKAKRVDRPTPRSKEADRDAPTSRRNRGNGRTWIIGGGLAVLFTVALFFVAQTGDSNENRGSDPVSAHVAQNESSEATRDDGAKGESSRPNEKAEALPRNDEAELIERVEESVVRIDVESGTDRKSFGSGFLAKGNGLIVTNHHVIAGCNSATVRFQDGSKRDVEGVVFLDEARDIAILKIVGGHAQRRPLPLANELPRKGERVYAFGAPKGMSFSVTEGIVSAVRTKAEMIADFADGRPKADELRGTWIQTSTPLSSDNSGGPLVNARGEAVGINTFVFREAQNLNFAISSKDVAEALLEARGKPVTPFESSSPLADATDELDSAADVSPAEPSDPNAPRERTPTRKRFDLRPEFLFGSSIPRDLSPAQALFCARLIAQLGKKLESIEQIKGQIEERREELKAALLAVDDKRAEAIRKEIAQRMSELRDKIENENALDVPLLSPERLRTGEMGILLTHGVRVVQVQDKEAGIALVAPLDYRGRLSTRLIRMQGIGLTSVVDGENLRVPMSLVFEVLGTTTYATVAGGTNTVFKLNLFGNLNNLKDNLQQYGLVEHEPTLTAQDKRTIARRKAEREAERKEAEEERAMMNAAIAAERWPALKLKIQEHLRNTGRLGGTFRRQLQEFSTEFAGTPQAETAEREAAAASKLQLALPFLAAGKDDLYRERLQELVETFADTIAASEASRILSEESKRR